ncbi:hypothetical protein WAF17_05540 [Bernardetia sp. ABR2-2B]|uniref:hypothetical protein n=1 Tax=Bernardetia sp. ABR2-2B TaxID=3127472 RepID=UPI0030D1D954
MKLKLFILFLLVFGAIGQTIFLNIDAKSNFLWESESQKNAYIHTLENEKDKLSIQPSEVVVTIRHHDSEILNQQNATEIFDEEAEVVKSTSKKPCSQITKEERLICQKAKEAAKQKQNRISGSNYTKNSTIQNP